MASDGGDISRGLKRTNHAGFFVNEQGVIVNDDELAWMKYKAEREKSKLLMDLVRKVEQLNRRIEELEKNSK